MAMFKKITVNIIPYVALVLVFLTACYVFLWVFLSPDYDNMELLGVYQSPTGQYTVRTYLGNGGATVDFSVTGIVIENETGKKRRIYYEYHCDCADVAWIDDYTVNINGVKLNVINDSYSDDGR